VKKHAHRPKTSKTYHKKDKAGTHVLLFVVVIILTFIILSSSTDLYPAAENVDAMVTSNLAGQAWGSVVRSYDGLILEGYGDAAFPESNVITRFCSEKYCNYQTCNWGKVKVAGPGCLVFALDIQNKECAYGISGDGETISTTPTTIDTIFSSGDATARALMKKAWRVDRGTYLCENNKWVFQK